MIKKGSSIYMGLSWVVPLPSNSHHQDYYIFSRGSRTKPSFATGILGGGTTQGLSFIYGFCHPNDSHHGFSPRLTRSLPCGLKPELVFKELIVDQVWEFPAVEKKTFGFFPILEKKKLPFPLKLSFLCCLPKQKKQIHTISYWFFRNFGGWQ